MLLLPSREGKYNYKSIGFDYVTVTIDVFGDVISVMLGRRHIWRLSKQAGFVSFTQEMKLRMKF